VARILIWRSLGLSITRRRPAPQETDSKGIIIIG
jgi:hypothetical protein